MGKTISVMTGRGSVKHNSRVFHADNTDPERTHLNHCYCNESIKDVYHHLFDDAVARYNAKQTRSDRKIVDYYEKIRTGKQEKIFHEIVVQIGNRADTPAFTEEGTLAEQVLDTYMQGFRQRNPNLYVFAAYLHMDEATPHLHIDFVPYITESKRGLDTRVSLKQALMKQGFKGGTREETERNQWVYAEKEYLAEVMWEQCGIEWDKKGTHNKHLSVLDFEKQARSKELAQLEKALESERATLQQAQDKTAKIERVEQIEVKPKTLDRDKVIVSKCDFEEVKELAQKQLASEQLDARLRQDNQELRKEVSFLRQDSKSKTDTIAEYQDKVFEDSQLIATLQSEIAGLKKWVEKFRAFIERFELKEQLQAFLKESNKKNRGR